MWTPKSKEAAPAPVLVAATEKKNNNSQCFTSFIVNIVSDFDSHNMECEEEGEKSDNSQSYRNTLC